MKHLMNKSLINVIEDIYFSSEIYNDRTDGTDGLSEKTLDEHFIIHKTIESLNLGWDKIMQKIKNEYFS